MCARRILFIDPSLIGVKGHHLGLARMISDQLEWAQIWFATHRTADQLAVLESKHVLRAFRYSMTEASRVRRYGRLMATLAPFASAMGQWAWGRESGSHRAVAEGPVLHAAADAARGKSLHGADLRSAFLRFDPRPQDMLLFASADAEQVLALAELLESGLGRGARIVLRLMYDDRSRHTTDFTWSTALTRLLNVSRKSAIQFAAETVRFAHAIATQTGESVLVWPHPSSVQASAVPSCRKPFRLFVPGEARFDKGRAKLQTLVDKVSSMQQGKLLFLSQTPASGDHVEVLPAHLDSAAYSAAWRDCHAAVLLHDPAVYAFRGSGVVCDAVTSGRPFVCLKGSSLEDWSSDGNAIPAAQDMEFISDAVDRLIKNYDEVLAQATPAQARMSRMQETAIRALRDGP